MIHTKKHLVRLLSIVLTLIMLFGMQQTTIYAAESPEGRSEAVPPTEAFAFAKRSTDHPGDYSVKTAVLPGQKTAALLPSTYNSAALGYITPVRNQGSYGTCWAHGAIASCEAYMVKHGIAVGADGSAATAASLNLSEYHLAWFCYTDAYDELGMLTGNKNTPSSSYLNLGAFGEIPSYTLMRWEGVASESTSALAYSNISASGLPASYAYAYNVGHVQDCIWIPTSDMDAVKAAIMEYGAGTFGYYHDNAYSNDTTGAYCCIQSASPDDADFNFSNHDVTVVGWDDNYSRSNFTGSSVPTADGAWIIKNSWGTYYGDDGYYYISYEDTASLNDVCYFYVVEPVDNYDNNYQYDGTTNFSNYQTLASGGSIANVFTANGAESLQAVALCNWDAGIGYTLSIYKDVTSTTDPTAGTLAVTQTGTLPYAGYHTITLASPLALSEGEKFSVVFTLTYTSSMAIPLDKSGRSSGWITWTHVSHANTSYCKSASASSWTNYSSSASYRIKAYTKDAPSDPLVCNHTNTTEVPAVAATCAEDGYTAGVYCNDCGTFISGHETIPATGHNLVYTNNGDGTHTYACLNDGCTLEPVTEAHTFSNGVCVCGATEAGTPTVDTNLRMGHTLYLDSDLSVIYRVNLTRLADYDISTAYLEIEKDVYTASGAYRVDYFTLTESYEQDGRLCFKFSNVQACEMNNELRARLHITSLSGEEFVSELDVYSVCAYAELAFQTTDTALKTLMIDMLNYGAAAQTYFGRNADNLANAAFSAYQVYATSGVSNVVDDKQTIVNADSVGAVTKFGTALNLEARIEIKYTLTLAEGIDASALTIEVRDADGALLESWNGADCETDSQGRLVCYFSGCNSTQMRKVVYLTAYYNGAVASNTLAYSIESYLPLVQSALPGSTLETLIETMIIYGDSAKAYFG